MRKNVPAANAVLRVTIQKDSDRYRRGIKQIRAENLTKDDFVRETSKIDRKLDKILEMMINTQKTLFYQDVQKSVTEKI